MTKRNKSNYKKLTLIIGLCALVLWSALGAGTSLAWFADSSSEIKNIVNVADFDLEVTFRQEDGVTYEPINDRSDVFDEEALYEPGYTQIIYLRIKNNGTVPFNYQTAAIIQECVIGTSVFGTPINLQEYLRYGIITADSEAALNSALSDREKAVSIATNPLNDYYSGVAPLDDGQTKYLAMIVHMPKEISNEANYRGLPVPELKLGISVTATQQQ